MSPTTEADWKASGLIALAVALFASAALLWFDPPAPRGSEGPLTIARAWPGAKVVDSPGRLADGAAYTPLHHLDATTSVGTALVPGGSAVRLVLRSGDGEPRELRRLPGSANPQFGGFAAAGDDLVWAESTTAAGGQGETRLWRANWRSDSAPATLTAEVGDAVFFNSQYDLVLADGRVHWVAAGRTNTPTTEVRSVPLSGGPVTVQPFDGAYALAGWPWLTSAGGGQTGPIVLRNLADGRTMTVPAEPTELVACSPAWCRVLVIAGGTGPARIDLMRPDGTQRQKMASGLVSATVTDVAVLDRFEVLTLAGREGSATSSRQLLLYDADGKGTVVVSGGAGMVLCRGGVLWWSTGDNEALAWHALDLRTLT